MPAVCDPPSMRRVTTRAMARPPVWPNAADPVAQRSRLACDTVATWLWNLVRIVPATALLCAASTPWAVAMVPRLWSMAESTPLAAPAVSAAPRTVRWHGCGRKCL